MAATPAWNEIENRRAKSNYQGFSLIQVTKQLKIEQKIFWQEARALRRIIREKPRRPSGKPGPQGASNDAKTQAFSDMPPCWGKCKNRYQEDGDDLFHAQRTLQGQMVPRKSGRQLKPKRDTISEQNRGGKKHGTPLRQHAWVRMWRSHHWLKLELPRHQTSRL